MRTISSFIICLAMLAALAACSQPPSNPIADHGAQNTHGPGCHSGAGRDATRLNGGSG